MSLDWSLAHFAQRDIPNWEPRRKIAPQKSSGQRRVLAVVGPLCFLLVLWIYLFTAEGAFSGGPNGKTFGADFAMFVGAARVMQNGGNPYDHQLLYRSERAWMATQHLKMLSKPDVVRVGNPPQLFWALQPFARMRFQMVAYGWMLTLYALSALGFLLLLTSQGWRRKVIPTLIFLLMPQAVLGPFYGNVTTLVFVGVCLAIAFSRTHSHVAGAALTLAWLKPPVGLPIVMLVLLFQAPKRREMIVGFLMASAAFFGCGLAVTGPHMMQMWVQALLGYSRDVGSTPGIASFAGLYVRSAPYTLRLGVEILGVAGAALATAVVWSRNRPNAELPWIKIGWLWALWFLAAPYAHFYDEVLLAIPVLAVLGRDARNLTQREPVIVLYVALASLLLISATPHNVQLLWVPLLMMLLALYLSSRNPALTDAPTFPHPDVDPNTLSVGSP